MLWHNLLIYQKAERNKKRKTKEKRKRKKVQVLLGPLHDI